MTSRITSETEFGSSVNSKANGQKDGGYKMAMEHLEDTIRSGLISKMPVSISYEALTPHGLPVVNKRCKNLMQNLQESIKPSPKSAAMMRSMNKLIAENLVKRIPAIVKKENDENPDRVDFHRAYIYVDRDYYCPDWWPRRLNEPGKLHDLSYKNYYRRIIPGRESSSMTPPVRPAATRTTRTNHIVSMLPTSPTPDLVVDHVSTPGTLDHMAQQLGLESTLVNRRRISSLLNSAMTNGSVGRVYRNSISGIKGHATVSIYYKIV